MQKKLTIVLVADVLGKENNGTTIAGMNFARFLVSQGHEVRIVAPSFEGIEGVKFYPVPRFKFGIFDKYVMKNGVVAARADYSVLREAFKGADVVHSMLAFSLGKATAKLTKELNIPLTAGFHTQAENITAHVLLMNLGLANHVAYRTLFKRLYKHADAIHYPTQFIKDVFEKHVGPTNAFVISNGVNNAFRKVPTLANSNPLNIKAKFTILFSGRLAKEKTHDVLINAIKYSKHKDDIQLVFAGSGPLEKQIRHKARNLTHPLIIKFFNRKELVEVLNNTTLYVHPAQIEIEAISCLEAISAGLVPVISNSKKSATKYFALDENNLFENKNARDLARKIDYWLDNEEERNKRSEQYLNYTKKFNYDFCMNQMEQMLYTVVKNGKQQSK